MLLLAGRHRGDGLDDAHEDAGLGAVALGLDGHEGDEGVDGAAYAGHARAGPLAEGRQGVEALERVDEEGYVAERQEPAGIGGKIRIALEKE